MKDLCTVLLDHSHSAATVTVRFLMDGNVCAFLKNMTRREPKTNPSKGIDVNIVLVKPVDILGKDLSSWECKSISKTMQQKLVEPHA